MAEKPIKKSSSLPSEAELRAAKKEAKRYANALKLLCAEVRVYLAHMDVVMTKPQTPERGREIARLSNALEMVNDQTRYFVLGVDYRKEGRHGEQVVNAKGEE